MIILGVSIVALLISMLTFYLYNQNRKSPKEETSSFNPRPLQLQAYERLVVLAERISLPNLISRVNQAQPGFSAKEMQLFLLENIKQEYEYNASQQIYVTEAAWDAVRSLRDQNLLMVNTISKSLPTDATATELNKRLMEAMMQEEKAAIHTYTAHTLNAEAKKIM